MTSELASQAPPWMIGSIRRPSDWEPSDYFLSPAVQKSEASQSEHSQGYLQHLTLTAKVLLILGLLALGYVVLQHRDSVLELLDRGVSIRNQLGWWYPVLYFLVHLSAIIFLVPAELVTISGGFLFTYDSYFGYKVGIAVATLVTTASLCLGTTLLFFVSRKLLKGRLMPYVRHSLLLNAFLDVLTEGGLCLAITLRLVPIMPFSLGNVLFGLTDLPFWPVLISVLGTLPGTFLFCWIGADCQNVRSILAGERQSDIRDTVVTVGTLLSIAVIVYYLVTRIRLRLTLAAEGKVDKAKSVLSSSTFRPYRPLRTRDWINSSPSDDHFIPKRSIRPSNNAKRQVRIELDPMELDSNVPSSFPVMV
eukprot:Gregarina_sp_Poly_1__3664@NODE_207_length_11414_cov_43_030493_g184_i0_p4_GENE_NODE_207_length_11414_cov_43_030493_g184_i0NODE_207_length_11414_cov_43_030493_g184_i0_p4_ORF_typecomplete_len363_score29_89SNARE_assoc/PF09335_11/2_4e14SNARE_assoc/PF09335_11/1_1e03_NODE_207_length_11414_cov_43_030493_g184_i038754963